MTTRTAPFMAAEIGEQADLLARIVERRQAVIDAVRAVVPPSLRSICLVGRGTSGHAALFGRLLLERAANVPATVQPASYETISHPRTPQDDTLAIGLSQSGWTRDVATTLAALADRGATTIALTADPGGPLAVHAALTLDLGTGREHAVPATKTFTAELAMIALIAEALGLRGLSEGAWRATVAAVRAVLADPVEQVAARLDGVSQLTVLGAGLMMPIALEGALKLLETARIAALAFSPTGFRHGPVAIAGPAHPVLLIDGAQDLKRSLRNEGVPVIVIGPDPGADIVVAAGLPEPLAAIPVAVRMQQLALATALRRGLDPDSPPRLAKVTL